MKKQQLTKQLKFDKISVSELDNSKLVKIAGGTVIGATRTVSNITEYLELSNKTFCNSDVQ